jgi:hypothetical protein
MKEIYVAGDGLPSIVTQLINQVNARSEQMSIERALGSLVWSDGGKRGVESLQNRRRAMVCVTERGGFSDG